MPRWQDWLVIAVAAAWIALTVWAMCVSIEHLDGHVGTIPRCWATNTCPR